MWATCRLSSGESVPLVLTKLSPDGASLWSMLPPEVASQVHMVIRPLDGSVVPPIVARVTDTRQDSSDAAACGFDVAFPKLDEDRRDQLAVLAEKLTFSVSTRVSKSAPPGMERRAHARVKVRLDAHVEQSTGPVVVRVHDLSMSGAQLELGQAGSGERPQRGAKLEMTLLASSVPEAIPLQVRIVRVIHHGKPGTVAVQFLGLDQPLKRRLEGLILHALVGARLTL